MTSVIPNSHSPERAPRPQSQMTSSQSPFSTFKMSALQSFGTAAALHGNGNTEEPPSLPEEFFHLNRRNLIRVSESGCCFTCFSLFFASGIFQKCTCLLFYVPFWASSDVCRNRRWREGGWYGLQHFVDENTSQPFSVHVGLDVSFPACPWAVDQASSSATLWRAHVLSSLIPKSSSSWKHENCFCGTSRDIFFTPSLLLFMFFLTLIVHSTQAVQS